MRATLQKYLYDIRSSYWFLPSLMAVASLVLAFATAQLDQRVEVDLKEHVNWLYSNRPDGARALLATVAGSMITVTGVTFSLTILAISYATGQYGPRLLSNFMQDRTNQFTLGTFISTFLYCLMILRTVRSAEEADNAGSAMVQGAFVPHISVFVALLLTLTSVAVLIHFIHHIPESIHIPNVLHDVGSRLNRKIDLLYPEQIGQEIATKHEPSEASLEEQLADSDSIASNHDGYLQGIADDSLIAAAQEKDLLIRVVRRPGDFVSAGEPLMRVAGKAELTDELRTQLLGGFIWGYTRTETQDAFYLIDQLVEVAARALSPGVNDPMTAIMSMNWLQSALMKLATRNMPSRFRYDEQEDLRLVTGDAVGLEAFCEAIFTQLRPYVATDANAARHMMRMINTLIEHGGNHELSDLLERHADQLCNSAKEAGLFQVDLAALESIKEHRADTETSDSPRTAASRG